MHYCTIHNIYWETTPSRVLQGAGCEQCGYEKISNSKYKSHKQYIKEVEKSNPNIEVIENYAGVSIPIKHYCKKHNLFWSASPDNILHGHGCLECGKEKIGDKNTKSHNQYVSELKEINSNIIVIDAYINAYTPVLHKCLIDGYEWSARLGNVLNGTGCPKCRESSGERQIRQWLEKHNIKYIYQKVFNDCRDINPLPFDFYLPDNVICIEYDGGQHTKPVDHFGGVKAFDRIVKHDRMKNEYCKNNGVPLLRIPYFKNVEEELNNFLFI